MPENINSRIYNDHADAWWDENQFLYLLKIMINPWRVPCFRDALVRAYFADLSLNYLGYARKGI